MPKKFITRFTKEEIEFIRNNSSTMSHREMADYFGCTLWAISCIIRKYGFDAYSGYYRRWDKDKAKDFLNDYYGGLDRNKIAEKYYISTNSIGVYACVMKKKYELNGLVK